MSNDCLSEDQVRHEAETLIEILSWSLSEEGIKYHTTNVGTSHPYGIVAGMLDDVINYGIDRGWNPAYLIGYLILRMKGQHPEWREELGKLLPSSDILDDIMLDDEMVGRVNEFRKNINNA